MVNFLKNGEFSFFIVTVIILGMDFALGSGFLVLLLDQVHTPNAVMGVVFAVASLTEVMIYPFSAKITKLIGGEFSLFYCRSFFILFKILAIFIYKELLTYLTNTIVTFDGICFILVSCGRI